MGDSVNEPRSLTFLRGAYAELTRTQPPVLDAIWMIIHAMYHLQSQPALQLALQLALAVQVNFPVHANVSDF